MDKRRAKRKVDQAIGRAKRQVEEWTDNAKDQVADAAGQVTGQAERAWEKMKDAGAMRGRRSKARRELGRKAKRREFADPCLDASLVGHANQVLI
jgi:uncharacterized protein YjbJ (UPF0337 family)